MFFFQSQIIKIGYHDMQNLLRSNMNDFLIINTLSNHLQQCLIQKTVSCVDEPRIINEYISKYNFKKKLIVYGQHSCDVSAEQKANQLTKHGFTEVYVYVGGLFEWLLLQDIYGEELFPTTSAAKDLLTYKPGIFIKN